MPAAWILEAGTSPRITEFRPIARPVEIGRGHQTRAIEVASS